MGVWNKKQLHKLLLEKIREEREATLKAAMTAKEGATHEDAVAKSKYDTHGLELSYLAGSQFERARQAESKLTLLENTPFPEFQEDDIIDVGALVVIRSERNNEEQTVLISNLGAGYTLEDNQRLVLVISPESPLGEALISLGIGDDFQTKGQRSTRYEVIDLA